MENKEQIMSNDHLFSGPILPRQSIKIMDYDDAKKTYVEMVKHILSERVLTTQSDNQS